MLGFTEILIILLIVIVIFGAKRIPELGRGLGSGIRNFSSALKGEDDDSGDPGDEGAQPDEKQEKG